MSNEKRVNQIENHGEIWNKILQNGQMTNVGEKLT